MSLRVVLVDHPDQHDRLQTLAKALPSDWVVMPSTQPESVVEDATMGGIDVVITGPDPGTMDGATLLRRVQKAHPEALRVLALPVGFDARLGERLAADAAVQQVLAAPFTEADVRRVVRRVLTVRSLLRDSALRAELGQVERLPASPTTYLTLRMVMADDGADTEQAIAALKRDPALAARVLRTANSALYSRGRAINDVAAAVQRLGLQTITQLVLAGEVFSRLSTGPDSAKTEQQSLIASSLAMHIARTPREGALAASAALLADVGALLPGSVLNAPEHPGELWAAAPRVALLGAGLMALWGLPMEMVEAVAFRHTPSRLPGRGLDIVGITHIACALAAETPVDEAYVESAHLGPPLEGWRAMAETLRERSV